METLGLIEIIGRGEDSHHQFKERLNKAKEIAKDLIAFNNTEGGYLLVGVSDDYEVKGLSPDELEQANRLIADAATNNVRPPINIISENVEHPDGMVIVVRVEKGLRPCADNDGRIWVKNGSDKRAVTAIEEMQRMFQAAALVHADEVSVENTSVNDIDTGFFADFYQRRLQEELDPAEDLSGVLESMNLLKDDKLNLSGTLMFARNPQVKKPAFIVKAVCFPGTEITEQEYIDSRDLSGKLADLLTNGKSFVLNNIHHRQDEQSVNSVGEPEIPAIVFEELIANALIHRDYFISAPIRLFVFRDRIEIISPGHLPNNLTVENIVNGNSNHRNPIIASFAPFAMSFRGIGSGIRRALVAWPDIEFIDDRAGNKFTAVIRRTQ
ncbi:RNA-binding domain-containing protein [Ferrimonas aestuarii]|uniref:ATP-dependent DNA helicase RecG n=1 Tax=Ferrimonas aestuarii TaxID=2569539 RepID=A0A4U1BK50_9GAMM|nr:RNA-binding domain-containing protein [Ferrimonas aestuarii]TKB51814.1 ATP-dependent DNA helicase RecG [Ferrimonas aestuarii]